MNLHENKLIKEAISADFRKISNPDFTQTTLARIRESRIENRVKATPRLDLTLLYPVLGFSFLLILSSIANLIGLWIEIETLDRVFDVVILLSGLLFHPTTLSLMVASLILYRLDMHLKKPGARITTPDSALRA